MSMSSDTFPLYLPSPVQRFVDAWNRFWFTPADPTTLGVIRIFCGLLTLYVHLAYSFDLNAFMGADAWIDNAQATRFWREAPYFKPVRDWDWNRQQEELYKEAQRLGLDENLPSDPELRKKILEYRDYWDADPRMTYSMGHYGWSIYFHATDPRAVQAVHIGILIVMFLFTIGFCTRVTSVLTWLAAVSYINRSSVTVFGQDTMMNLALLYLMIGPSGAALSVDRLISRYWATRRALREHRPPPPFLRPEPLVSANLAIRLLQVNFCFIYLVSGLSKLEGKAWWNLTALQGIVLNYQFTPMPYAWYRHTIYALAKNRWVWEIFIGAGTLYTLVLEIGFPFLAWRPSLRWIMVSGSILLHSGIALTMGLRVFSLFMLGMVLSFIPPEVMRRQLWRLGRGTIGARLAEMRRAE